MLARQQATGGATNVLASAAVAAADMDGGEGWGDDDLDDFSGEKTAGDDEFEDAEGGGWGDDDDLELEVIAGSAIIRVPAVNFIAFISCVVA